MRFNHIKRDLAVFSRLNEFELFGEDFLVRDQQKSIVVRQEASTRLAGAASSIVAVLIYREQRLFELLILIIVLCAFHA